MQRNAHPLLLRTVILSLFGWLLSMAIAPLASAHLMVAQHGTLNIVGDGVFMVMSVPVSAFEGIDDDGDQKLSQAEFSKHQPALAATVNAKIKLFEKDELRPLQGMLLSPVTTHIDPTGTADQLVIMGRYQLTDVNSLLRFHLELFGKKPNELQQAIAFTHKARSIKNKVILTPKQMSATLSETND